MSIENKVKNIVNYITGSGGNWPNLSRAGILGGFDYIIETGSNDIYFCEMNTNVRVTGNLSTQQSIFNKISDYASSQSFNTAYVYGVTINGTGIQVAAGIVTAFCTNVGSAVTINPSGIDAISGIVTANTLKGTTGTFSGTVTANAFSGDGGDLTGLNIPAGFTELDAALFN